MSVQEGLGEAALVRGATLSVPVSLGPAAPGLVDLAPVFDGIEVTAPRVDGPAESRSRPARSTGRLTTRLGAGLAVVQSALRRPSSIAVDLAAAGVAGTAATGRLTAGAIAAALFLASGLLFGLWQARTSVEAYGTGWYLKALVPPLAASGVASVVLGQTPASSAEKYGVAAFALLGVVHLAAWLALVATRRAGTGLAPTLLVGATDDTGAVARRLEVYPEMGLAVVGTCDPEQDLIDGAEGHATVERIVNTWSPAHVLCVDSPATREVFRDLVAYGQERVDVTLALPLTRITCSARRLGDIGLIPVKTRQGWGSAAAKRLFDVIVASVVILLASPLLLATAIAIRLEDHGPLIFRQLRPGRHGVPFEILKFRSMTVCSSTANGYLSKVEVGSLTFKVKADPRVTRVGRLIRRLSIDELPQLFNVVKGDMSLVGPRPLAFDPEEYQGRARLRHSVRPGITGLWQVSGANALDDEDMIELDLNYVAHHSLGMDLFLLLRTLSAVVIRRAPV